MTSIPYEFRPDVHEEIKRSWQKPLELTAEEAIEILKQQMWLGPPTPLQSGTRGPKSTKTNYDKAAALRREPLRRLAIAPLTRRATFATQRWLVLECATVFSHAEQHKLTSMVLDALAKAGGPLLLDRTVRKYLREAGLWIKPTRRGDEAFF